MRKVSLHLTFATLVASALIGLTYRLMVESPKYGPEAAAPVGMILVAVVVLAVMSSIVTLKLFVAGHALRHGLQASAQEVHAQKGELR